MKKPRYSLWVWPLLAVFIFCAGFALAAIYDLPLDQAIYSPDNPFAIIMEFIGWFPAFVPPIFFFVLFLQRPRAQRATWQTLGALFVSLCGFAGLFLYAAKELHDRRLLNNIFWFLCLCVLWVVIVATIIIAAVRCSRSAQAQWEFWALCGTVFLIGNLILIAVGKQIWQRTRFDDMLATGSFAQFTPWYHPFGNGGSSFPSGHTAKAAGIFALVFACDIFAAWDKKRTWVYLICWSYTILMAFSRLLMGRHFLSDTLVATAIIVLLLFALRRLPIYKKYLSKCNTLYTYNPFNKKEHHEL